MEEKLDLNALINLIETVTEQNKETEKIFLTKLEESTQGVFSFKEDMENPIYKRLVQVIKEIKKAGKK